MFCLKWEEKAGTYKYLMCGKVQMAKYYISSKAAPVVHLHHSCPVTQLKNIVELGSYYVLWIFSNT